MNMSSAAGNQALEEGKKRLREFLESSDTGRQALGMAPESIELSTRPKGGHTPRKPRVEQEEVDEI